MIFVTVGSQIPFDRMMKTIDEWAFENKSRRVFAQTGVKSYEPQNFHWVPKMEFSDYENKINEAKYIIAHAGMGTIITAITHKKPIVIMPRRAKYNEHRNDHQYDTANALKNMPGVHIAWDEDELRSILDKLDYIVRPKVSSLEPDQSLIHCLKDFLKNA
jgi:UDP-N-acetylglucosamine transferase subunit ALG13